MRRREHHAGFGKSFDAFLSIVTKNGLGMLILVAMASTFTNEAVLSEPRFKPVRVESPTRPVLQGDEQVLKVPRLKLKMGTPLVKKAAPNAKMVAFECQGDRIFPSDFKTIGQAYWGFFIALANAANMDVAAIKQPNAWAVLQDRLGKYANMEARAKEFNAQRHADEWYNFEIKARCGEPGYPDEPAMYCSPKSKSQGETFAEAIKTGSLFGNSLKTIDKNQDVVIISVWSDSFPFFRELRDWLRSEGYRISWEPVDKPLMLPPPWRLGSSPLRFDE